jgi:hypothetical protein
LEWRPYPLPLTGLAVISSKLTQVRTKYSQYSYITRSNSIGLINDCF